MKRWCTVVNLLVAIAVLLFLGCFEGPHIDEHPCYECEPCQTCTTDYSGTIICVAEDHAYTQCGEDGHVHWFDSCAEEQDLQDECSNAECVNSSSTTAVCSCTNHWQGEDCEECPDNWDPEQDCAVCENHWVDEDNDCGTCPGNWDPDLDCNTCLNHWHDEGNDCGTCPGNWDAAEDCNACVGNWDPEWDCLLCIPNWMDNDDDCGTFLFSADFDTTPGGFLHSSLSGGTTHDPWERGVATGGQSCHSGSCFATTLDGNYPECQDAALVSPAINLSPFALSASTMELTFWHWYNIESPTGDTWWEGGMVQFSDNGGSSWDDVSPSPSYQGVITTGDLGWDGCPETAFVAGHWAWSGDIAGDVWTQVTVPILESYYVSDFRFRFVFGSDEAIEDLGWLVDDIIVQNGETELDKGASTKAPESFPLGQYQPTPTRADPARDIPSFGVSETTIGGDDAQGHA
jgi:hypothetical protein